MNYKRFFSRIVIFFMLLVVLNTTALARASSQIVSCEANLSLLRNGDLQIFYFVDAVNTMDTLGASSIAVQRYSGSWWITEYTYTTRNAPEIQGSDVSGYGLKLDYTPDYSNAAYRAVVYFYAKSGSQTSTAQATTVQVTT